MLVNPPRRRRPIASAVVAALATVGGLVVGVATSAPAQADVLSAGGDFVAYPNTPTLGDTRSGVGFPKAQLTAGKAVDLPVTLPGGVSMSSVSAVLVSTTVISPSNTGFLKAYPSGGDSNGTSQLNFVAATTTSNTVALAVPANRTISFVLNAGTADLLVNVQGYYTSATAASGPGGFVGVDHSRVFDTRSGLGGVPKARVAGGKTLTVDFSSVVPAGTPSVYIDLIVVGAPAAGYLRVRTATATADTPSRVNFNTGDTAQGIAVPLSSGKAVIEVLGLAATSAVDLVGTLEGYTTSTSNTGAGFRPLQARLAGAVSVAAGASTDVQVGGRNGLPLTGVAGAALNFTVPNAAGVGSLQAFPVGGVNNGTSLANFKTGDYVSDFAIVKPGTDGKITVVNKSAVTISLYVDQQGWFDAQTTTIASRKFTPTAAIQLPPNPGDTTAAQPIVYSWVDENGELHVSQQDDLGDLTTIKTVTVSANQLVRGPVSLGLNGSSVQASVQSSNTDALVKNGPTASTNIAQWQSNPYVDFGGSMASAPAIATNPDGSLTLFAVDTAGALWLFNESDAAPAWSRVPGAPALTTAFSVLPLKRGVQIAAIATDKTVTTALYSGGVVSAWTSLGGSGLVERPAIAVQPGDHARIAVRQGAKVLTKAQTQDGTFPSTWTSLTAPAGTTLVGAPAAVQDPSTGRNVLIVRAADANQSYLWAAAETGQSTGKFGGWSQVAGTDGVGTDPTTLIYQVSTTKTFEIVWRDSFSNSLKVSKVQI